MIEVLTLVGALLLAVGAIVAMIPLLALMWVVLAIGRL